MKAPTNITVARPRLVREAVRWGLAGAVVVAGHFAVGYGVAAFAPGGEPAATVEAMTVELAPLVMSEAEPVPVESVEEEQPEIVAEQQEELPAEPEQTDEEAAEEEPVEEQQEEVAKEEPVEELAPTPQVKKAEVVLPKPVRPKPVKKPEPRKPVVKKEPPKKVVRRAERPSERPSASRGATAGRSMPKAPRVNPSRWHSQVRAAIVRRKPRGLGQSGRVVIRFVVSPSGAVTSAGIASSSGIPALDRAALSMARGGRVPAAPEGVGATPFTIPVDFR